MRVSSLPVMSDEQMSRLTAQLLLLLLTIIKHAHLCRPHRSVMTV